MNILLDSCVWGGAAKALTEAGHQVEWVGAGPDPGDSQVLARAINEKRVLVTLDKDFGELAVVHGIRHHGIIRLVGLRAAAQGPAVVSVLTRYAKELADSAIVTVEPVRVRVRLIDG